MCSSGAGCSIPDSAFFPFAAGPSILSPLPCTAKFPACFAIYISITLSEAFAPLSSSEVSPSNIDFSLSTTEAPLFDAHIPLSKPLIFRLSMPTSFSSNPLRRFPSQDRSPRTTPSISPPIRMLHHPEWIARIPRVSPPSSRTLLSCRERPR